MATDRTLDTDRLLTDMRKLVAAVREQHAKTGTAGAPEAIAVMFALLDEQILEKGRLPAEWLAAATLTPHQRKCPGCRPGAPDGTPHSKECYLS